MQLAIILLNDAKRFTYNESGGYNLLQLSIHEIGHILGLQHSGKRTSIMYQDGNIYNNKADYQLDGEDIDRIQAIYGRHFSLVLHCHTIYFCFDVSIAATNNDCKTKALFVQFYFPSFTYF